MDAAPATQDDRATKSKASFRIHHGKKRRADPAAGGKEDLEGLAGDDAVGDGLEGAGELGEEVCLVQVRALTTLLSPDPTRCALRRKMSEGLPVFGIASRRYAGSRLGFVGRFVYMGPVELEFMCLFVLEVGYGESDRGN